MNRFHPFAHPGERPAPFATGSATPPSGFPPRFAGDGFEMTREFAPGPAAAHTHPITIVTDGSDTMLKTTSGGYLSFGPVHTELAPRRKAPRIPIVILGWSLGAFLALSFVLCVLFDLWLPSYAMYPAWAPLLPGFTWISWFSLALGLAETFAYGWFIALFFGAIFNFVASRSDARHTA